jgi:hypothetical protein
MIDFSRCRLPPFAHQREDVARMVECPYFFITSEMRTGKTKIVIDAAQFLFEQNVVDRVVVVAPAPVRDVWADRMLGELAKHLWLDLPARVTEFHARTRTWVHGELRSLGERVLDWYVTNFEFLRSKQRLAQLLPACDRRTLLVLDESSFVKNYAAAQTKACLQLRRACGRVVLLNGTPIFHSPLDLFSQGNLLHPSVLDCPYVTLFKARYALQQPVLGRGGKPLTKIVGKGRHGKEILIQEIVGWTNLDDLERRFAPVTVRRLQKDCLDLPPKLDPVTLTATLEPATWKAYKDMRDELVVWLQSGQVAVSATAAVKALRLSQITGGFLGGIEDARVEPVEEGLLESLDIGRLDWTGVDFEGNIRTERVTGETSGTMNAVEIGREKLDVLLWFIAERLEADPCLHLVAWTRFRAELFRALAEVRAKFPQFATGAILGGQKKAERLAALALLKPETSPKGPVFVAGIEGTGSFGIDMTAAHTCVTLSSGYSPGRVAQTLDRVYGPGQRHPIAYFTVVAVGPRGQRTIDHDVLAARLSGEDVATRTSAAWVARLTEE